MHNFGYVIQCYIFTLKCLNFYWKFFGWWLVIEAGLFSYKLFSKNTETIYLCLEDGLESLKNKSFGSDRGLRGPVEDFCQTGARKTNGFYQDSTKSKLEIYYYFCSQLLKTWTNFFWKFKIIQFCCDICPYSSLSIASTSNLWPLQYFFAGGPLYICSKAIRLASGQLHCKISRHLGCIRERYRTQKVVILKTLDILIYTATKIPFMYSFSGKCAAIFTFTCLWATNI